jgi:hypothetical protein
MTPFAQDDVWLSALNVLPDDPRPLAALLRSDTPMPHWVRYELADLIRAMPLRELSNTQRLMRKLQRGEL